MSIRQSAQKLTKAFMLAATLGTAILPTASTANGLTLDQKNQIYNRDFLPAVNAFVNDPLISDLADTLGANQQLDSLSQAFLNNIIIIRGYFDTASNALLLSSGTCVALLGQKYLTATQEVYDKNGRPRDKEITSLQNIAKNIIKAAKKIIGKNHTATECINNYFPRFQNR